jgi:hypothetical protein
MARGDSPRKGKPSRGAGGASKLPRAIRLTQKSSGTVKQIATGFAWDLFIFAGLFGVPLFWRRLPQWGAVILALWLLVLVVGVLHLGAAVMSAAEVALAAIFFAVQLWLGFAGNRLTAAALLAHGWTIERPDDATNKRVLARWGLTV